MGNRDYRPLEGQDQYEPVGLDDEVSDERDFATIMADRNAADMELDERDGLLNNDHRGRKLPSILRERGNSFRGLALHALHTSSLSSSSLSHS